MMNISHYPLVIIVGNFDNSNMVEAEAEAEAEAGALSLLKIQGSQHISFGGSTNNRPE
jgi:hypothetical protein